jgi:hypothetical protein
MALIFLYVAAVYDRLILRHFRMAECHGFFGGTTSRLSADEQERVPPLKNQRRS